ncbi:N-acetylmuramidase family protein [Acidisoma cellulosilytica]|uniref:N-acetylmuramidase family protein n=1 Tax=Acidisoma cellulosilyticum TaxID=2802395 RepID=A0A963Z386_9PROT|nr:N-acetylmuramidase family protein [Acidisoma cellulosilyticum]MCB8881726.1 N-acetylmuramidase family protein [Acidisoma cellulosilyticum]
MPLITTLTDADYASAAQTLGCDIPAIKAFSIVESGGQSGFLPDGRPKILFEAHIFHEQTSGKFDDHKDRSGVLLSTSTWIPSLYGAPGTHQWDRRDDAAALDPTAADSACSWGEFQIMGSNHAAVSFENVSDFVKAMKSGAGAHLDAFVAFIQSARLNQALKSHDWQTLARGYNGPGQVFGYASKLQAAYSRLITTQAV